MKPTQATGRALAERGADLAASHADAVTPNWSAAARDALESFLRNNPHQRFTAADVCRTAEAAGLPIPPDRRAWGSVFNIASKSGRIVRVGVTTSPERAHHNGFVTEWREGAPK